MQEIGVNGISKCLLLQGKTAFIRQKEHLDKSQGIITIVTVRSQDCLRYHFILMVLQIAKWQRDTQMGWRHTDREGMDLINIF